MTELRTRRQKAKPIEQFRIAAPSETRGIRTAPNTCANATGIAEWLPLSARHDMLAHTDGEVMT